MPRPQPEPPESDSPLERTAALIVRARSGDAAAREELARRFLGPLLRWAHGRLPSKNGRLLETPDIVLEVLEKALNRLEDFEPRGEGSFLRYLRAIVRNRIVDEYRSTNRRPLQVEVGEDLPHGARSPLADAISAETFEIYGKALQRFRPRTQKALILRLEFGFTFPEIAAAIDSTSPNAVRMLVARSILQLAEMMREYGIGDG